MVLPAFLWAALYFFSPLRFPSHLLFTSSTVLPFHIVPFVLAVPALHRPHLPTGSSIRLYYGALLSFSSSNFGVDPLSCTKLVKESHVQMRRRGEYSTAYGNSSPHKSTVGRRKNPPDVSCQSVVGRHGRRINCVWAEWDLYFLSSGYWIYTVPQGPRFSRYTSMYIGEWLKLKAVLRSGQVCRIL